MLTKTIDFLLTAIALVGAVLTIRPPMDETLAMQKIPTGVPIPTSHAPSAPNGLR